MTLALLSHFFDKETLKVSSVTGSGGSAAKEGRQPLDKAIVDYIIGITGLHNFICTIQGFQIFVLLIATV